jgi:hypothetical protein
MCFLYLIFLILSYAKVVFFFNKIKKNYPHYLDCKFLLFIFVFQNNLIFFTIIKNIILQRTAKINIF